jgi:U3 small nucleolar RNA-associated protein MPP10
METPPLLYTLEKARHAILQPTPDIPLSAIALAKEFLDPLASDIAQTQTQRRDENRRKRKRGQDDRDEQVLQIRTVYTKGLGVKQIWEQARRIIDAARDEVERAIPDDDSDDEAALEAESLGRGAPDDDEDEHVDFEDVESVSGDSPGSEAKNEDVDEEEEDLSGEDIENDDDLMNEDLSDGPDQHEESWRQDPNGLNDGFFSIDDFNRQSQFLEQIDARGDDDNLSDEEDIDWDLNPLTQPLPKTTRSDVQNEAEASDSDGEDGGPTFGDADLNAPDTDDEDVDDNEEPVTEGYLDEGMPALNNTNEIRYADFFEPPPKKLSKTKRMRALPKTQPPKANPTGNGEADLDNDIERAMNDVNRDIFASESEASDSDLDASSSRNLSTHEKQRAKIAAEIRRLEAANVAKRDWTLSGEARAVDRPINSLIEEDMEFERVGKPVPVVTAETSEEIEQLIKRRIIAREFDEVLKRHPDSFGNASEQRRGRIEVDDSKPQSGLADVYEQEHLKSTDPNYVDQRSKATKKAHAEIDRLWKDVSLQLDLLSNLHFKPRRVEAEVKVLEDKPRIAMEDARPVGEGVEEQSMLAPQEVYRAGDKSKRVAEEVVTRGGAAVSKEEMSREDKKRRRMREKERVKKGKVNQGVEPRRTKSGKQKKNKGEEKQDILDELRRGGVKVVDKKGELQSLSSKKGRGGDEKTASSSSALKL